MDFREFEVKNPHPFPRRENYYINGKFNIESFNEAYEQYMRFEKEVEERFWAKAAEEVGISLDHPKFELLKELAIDYAELLYPNYSTDFSDIFSVFERLAKLVT